MGDFKDHFSAHAAAYRSFRPSYPPELFQYLASLCATRKLAWDCATGNGQAACDLAQYFDSVIATDASAEQIDNAIECPNVTYSVCPAEKTSLENGSVDLVTVAQALHWFDFEAFFAETKRVLKQNGVLAIWAYPMQHAKHDRVDQVIRQFNQNLIENSYWPSERRHVENCYSDVSFPFVEIKAPQFFMRNHWSKTDFINYVSTWSAIKKYRERNGEDPIAELRKQLDEAWPADSILEFEIPLCLKVGRPNA